MNVASSRPLFSVSTTVGKSVKRWDSKRVLRLVFAPNSDTLASATEFLVQGALQQYLGDLIQADAVSVVHDDSTLRVTVQYTVRRTAERKVVEFTR